MEAYQKAVQAFMDALVHKSGGGVDAETIAPQEVAGVALILRDGRVALFGGGRL